MHSRSAIAALALFTTIVLVDTVPVATSGVSGAAAEGKLELRAALPWKGAFTGDCPGTTPGTILCYTHQGRGLVRGLGMVSHSYAYPVMQNPPGCKSGSYRVPGYTVRFVVAGKGALQLAVPGSNQCLSTSNVLEPRYPPIEITGGSGVYAGASGSGTLVHDARYVPGGAAGTDTWTGNLVVPGLTFDVTAPVLTGTVGKTVRTPRDAKRARVGYRVTARDGVDGVVPVSCLPRSNSSFKIGRTIVTCSATDASGNSRAAKFAITVKPG